MWGEKRRQEEGFDSGDDSSPPSGPEKWLERAIGEGMWESQTRGWSRSAESLDWLVFLGRLLQKGEGQGIVCTAGVQTF